MPRTTGALVLYLWFLVVLSPLALPLVGAGGEIALEEAVGALAGHGRHGVDVAVEKLFSAGDQLAQQGRERVALRVMGLAARLDPFLVEARLYQGILSCKVGNVSGASASFAQALARTLPTGHRDEERMRGLRALVLARDGLCLMEARRFGPAATRLRASLEIDPGQEGLAWQLALALEYGGQWPASADAYLAWLRLLPPPPAPPGAASCAAPGCAAEWGAWLGARRAGRTVVAIFCPNRVEGVPEWGPVAAAPPPPPLLRINRTRRVPHPVLIGHAVSLTPY
jgi:tetratricopeptide (TPR) repeat protein